jgi:very-short-patch-repair endonuclease
MAEALNLWHPPGLVTGALALHLYAPSLPVPQVADFIVSNGTRLTAPRWVRISQSGPMRASSSPNGIACAVPERALIDAWGRSAPHERRDLIYQALWNRVCSWKQLRRELVSVPRIVDRRELVRILDWFAAGATSPLEVRAQRETFAGPRFREFEWQVDVSLGSRRARADVMHRATKVIVELDGDQFHSRPAARDADRARDIELAAAGYVTLRFGWHDIVERPQWCRRQVLAVVAQRRKHSGSA